MHSASDARVVHRRAEPTTCGFIHEFRRLLFGTPMLFSFPADKVCVVLEKGCCVLMFLLQPVLGRDVYSSVWPVVQSMLSTIGAHERDPLLEPNSTFVLAVVNRNGTSCGRCRLSAHPNSAQKAFRRCTWDKFCLGCVVQGEEEVVLTNAMCLAVDWSPHKSYTRMLLSYALDVRPSCFDYTHQFWPKGAEL